MTLEKIIDAAPSGIILLSEEQKILYSNNEITRILGYGKDQIKNRTSDILKFYQKENDLYEIDFKSCIDDEKRIQNTVYVKNGEGKYSLVFVSIAPLFEEGQPARSILMIHDISTMSDCEVIFKRSGEENANGFYNLVGRHKKMTELYEMIKLASESNANILITGESGTGKELVARAIHGLSERNNKPFITVNCSSLSETLLESELFGHVKGSFTGAYKDKIGRFEMAEGGTIFLDEIGDISPLIQLKLLRVIQEKTISRVGDNREIKVDMRILTATNKNLRELIASGGFREDLYYRLKVFTIHTPPLRDRGNDIPLLCDHFIRKFNEETGKKINGFTDDAMRLIMDYCWPGNIRELENSIEHAFVVCKTGYIDIFDLPQEIRVVKIKEGICGPADEEQEDRVQGKKGVRNRVTRDELVEILKENNYNKTLTAESLGISRVALWKKIKKFGIDDVNNVK
ncbi:MAG: sigma 54-interacting transcriptional regulator [Spirochaetales bacterium]|nr:sigma 54-interacting transcriptional regulator [Spirochaetales bacterium]